MEKKRPVLITVICIIMVISVVFVIPMIFSDMARSIGAWYPPCLAISAVIGLVCMIGLWMMKKWSIILYTAFVVVNQLVMLAMGAWNVLALLIPAIVIVVGLSQFSKMD